MTRSEAQRIARQHAEDARRCIQGGGPSVHTGAVHASLAVYYELVAARSDDNHAVLPDGRHIYPYRGPWPDDGRLDPD